MTTAMNGHTSAAHSLPQAPTGIQGLDELTRGGLPRGRPTLVCGSAGCGKTVLGIEFLVRGATQFDEPGVLMAFEESEGQFIRNMRSIGFDMESWVERGLLRFEASRPTLYGLETHLATMHKQIVEFEPRIVVIDPMTNFTSVGSTTEVRSMIIRLPVRL